MHHRMRGSRGFRAAAEHVARQLRAYGLPQVDWESLPADGKTSTARSARARPGTRNSRSCGSWTAQRPDARRASGELGRDAAQPGPGQRERRRHRRARRRRRRARARPTTRARTCAGSSCSPRPSRRRSRASAVAALRRRRHRELRAEPAHGLVGRGREPGALGPPRHLRDDAHVRVHGVAQAGAPVPASGWRAARGSAAGGGEGRASTRAPTTS